MENMRSINMESVVIGLKFIAENRKLSDEELADGLKQLGCGWTWDDYREKFPNSDDESLFEGMEHGDLKSGASVVINMGSGKRFNRVYGDDRFLSVDDETSAYHFIRVVTGDASYTKENIEKRHSKN